MPALRTMNRNLYANEGPGDAHPLLWNWKSPHMSVPEICLLLWPRYGYCALNRENSVFFAPLDKTKSHISQWYKEHIPKCVFLTFCGRYYRYVINVLIWLMLVKMLHFKWVHKALYSGHPYLRVIQQIHLILAEWNRCWVLYLIYYRHNCQLSSVLPCYKYVSI